MDKRYKRKNIVLFTILICLITTVFVVVYKSKEKVVGYMPTSRYIHKAAEIEGKVYLFGGRESPKKPVHSIEVFEPETGKWTTKKASMQVLQHCFALAKTNGKIYLLGSDGMGSVEEYSPAEDESTIRKSSPVWRHDVGAVGFDGKVYVIGGFVDGMATGIVEEFDPVKDTWVQKANMPTPRGGLSVIAANGKIYAIGGADGEKNLKCLEEYDPKLDKWTVKTEMAIPRKFAEAVAIENKIFVIGGQRMANPFMFSASVEEYDITACKWIKKDSLPYGIGSMGATVVKEKIYITGGLTLGRSIKGLLSFRDMGAKQIIRYDPD